MKKAYFLPLGLFLVSVIACSKDNDDGPNEPPAPTSVEIISSATWKIDTMGFDTDNNGEIDTELPFDLEPCDADNTLTFNADSTGVYSEGASKCNSEDPDSKPFEWYFKDNDKVINIDGDIENLQGDIDVLTLSDSALVISNEITLPPPYPANSKLIIGLKK